MFLAFRFGSVFNLLRVGLASSCGTSVMIQLEILDLDSFRARAFLIYICGLSDPLGC